MTNNTDKEHLKWLEKRAKEASNRLARKIVERDNLINEVDKLSRDARALEQAMNAIQESIGLREPDLKSTRFSRMTIREAAELVMFESHGCEWCELWNEEIGAIYGKTSEAKIIPLRRVDIGGDRPSDLKHLGGLVYTPTFIVMQKGKEVGRIIGYPGEDFFWQLLNEIIVSKGLRATNGS